MTASSGAEEAAGGSAVAGSAAEGPPGFAAKLAREVCATEETKINIAARRNPRAIDGLRSGRGNNANLLFDGTSDSMGG